MKPSFLEDVSSEIAIFGPQEPQEGVLDLLSTGRKAHFFLEGVGSFSCPLFLLFSFYSSSSSPRPSLILLVLPFIRALFVRMFVPPGPHGGYLGCIWERLGSLLGRLEAV